MVDSLSISLSAPPLSYDWLDWSFTSVFSQLKTGSSICYCLSCLSHVATRLMIIPSHYSISRKRLSKNVHDESLMYHVDSAERSEGGGGRK